MKQKKTFVRFLTCALLLSVATFLAPNAAFAQAYPVVVPASSSGAASRAIVQINQADIYNNIANAYNTANYAIGVGSNAQNTANYAVNVGSAAQGAADYANARVNELGAGGARGTWATRPGDPVGLSNGCTTELVYCPGVWAAGQPVPSYTISGGCVYGYPPSTIVSAATVYWRKFPTSGNFNIPAQQPPSVNCPAGSGFVALSQVSEGPVGPGDSF